MYPYQKFEMHEMCTMHRFVLDNTTNNGKSHGLTRKIKGKHSNIMLQNIKWNDKEYFDVLSHETITIYLAHN